MRFTRLQAFAIHLGISLVIFLVLLAVLVFDWYRFPLFSIEGGWKAIQLIAGCDIVLGPLLTLIVYKPGKRHLKLDLSIIAAIQFAALVSGTAIAYLQRPVLMVFAEERFYSLSYDYAGLSGTDPGQLEKYRNTPYPLAIVTLPDDEDERRKVRLQSIGRGGLQLRGDLFEPQNAQFLKDIQTHSVDIEKLTAGKPVERDALESFKSSYGTLDDYYFLPLHGRYGRLILALRRADGSIVETLRITPPQA